MTKLNQIIAVEKGVKNDVNTAFTALYHTIQKSALFAGIAKSYQPRDEDGEHLPGEEARIQGRVPELLDVAAKQLTRLFDLAATKDATNQEAQANVTVDGQVLLMDMPVSTLLFLEKQLTDLHTFVSKLPVLDPTKDWSWQDATASWAATPIVTMRSKKIPRNHLKAPATDKHPAQVEVYYEDMVVGDWTTRITSGAVSQTRVNELLERIQKLRKAVKFAREEANSIEVTNRKIGEAIFGYLFA